MAKKTDLFSVGDLFQKWIKDNHYEDSAYEIKLREDWEKIMGKTIATETLKINYKNHRLYLKLKTAPLKEMLYIDKELVIKKINDYLGNVILEEIVFV